MPSDEDGGKKKLFLPVLAAVLRTPQFAGEYVQVAHGQVPFHLDLAYSAEYYIQIIIFPFVD